MANKVISIKMEESDIEKLKKYYGYLHETGFIMKDKLTFNGFLKHLLLDNLQKDFLEMEEHFRGVCLGFRFYNLAGMKLMNSYHLNEETYELYVKAMNSYMKVKECEQRKKATEFFSHVGIEYEDIQGSLYSEFYSSLENMKETASFWEKKAWEAIDYCNNDYDEYSSDMEMVLGSELSEEEKSVVISGMKQFIDTKNSEKMIKNKYV